MTIGQRDERGRFVSRRTLEGHKAAAGWISRVRWANQLEHREDITRHLLRQLVRIRRDHQWYFGTDDEFEEFAHLVLWNKGNVRIRLAKN